jgi:hypothetical protein
MQNEKWHDLSRGVRFILPFAFYILHFSISGREGKSSGTSAKENKPPLPVGSDGLTM